MPNLPEDAFDVRKLERYLNEGLLTQEQVDKHLAGLEDCAADADPSTIVMVAHARRRTEPSSESQHEEDEG